MGLENNEGHQEPVNSTVLHTDDNVYNEQEPVAAPLYTPPTFPTAPENPPDPNAAVPYPQYSQSYPSQPYPPQAYPPQTYPPQAYPPQSYPQPIYPPQNYPPQSYPPQNYPAQNYPPPNYPPQSYPPQAYPAGYVQPAVVPEHPVIVVHSGANVSHNYDSRPLACGIGVAWILFIVGWFSVISWFVGAFFACLGDPQERRGGRANLIMIILWVAIILFFALHW